MKSVRLIWGLAIWFLAGLIMLNALHLFADLDNVARMQIFIALTGMYGAVVNALGAFDSVGRDDIR